LDLGCFYRHTGWNSKAIKSWQAVWTEGKDAQDPKAKPYVDRALAELIMLNTQVGQTDHLSQLIPEAEARHLNGSSKEKVEAAKQAWSLMKKRPDISFSCGPLVSLTEQLIAHAEPIRPEDNVQILARLVEEHGYRKASIITGRSRGYLWARLRPEQATIPRGRGVVKTIEVQ
jgi:hypothetical protein